MWPAAFGISCSSSLCVFVERQNCSAHQKGVLMFVHEHAHGTVEQCFVSLHVCGSQRRAFGLDVAFLFELNVILQERSQGITQAQARCSE